MDDCSSLDHGCTNAAITQTERLLQDWDGFIVRMSRNLARRVKDRALEAGDIEQVARARLFRLAPKSGSRNWVGKVLYNEMRREAGRAASPEALDDEAYALADNDAPTEGELLMRLSVRQWVAKLKPELRAVYSLLYVENLTQRQAAERLECSQSRVNQLHQELVECGRLQFVRRAA